MGVCEKLPLGCGDGDHKVEELDDSRELDGLPGEEIDDAKDTPKDVKKTIIVRNGVAKQIPAIGSKAACCNASQWNPFKNKMKFRHHEDTHHLDIARHNYETYVIAVAINEKKTSWKSAALMRKVILMKAELSYEKLSAKQKARFDYMIGEMTRVHFKNYPIEVAIHAKKIADPIHRDKITGTTNWHGIVDGLVSFETSAHHELHLMHPINEDQSEHTEKADLKITGPTGWIFISDVDDTIKKTMDNEPTGMLRNSFIEPFEALPGMAAVYRHFAEKMDCPFFYVSASPNSMYSELTKFLRENEFPFGMLLLQAVHTQDMTDWVTSAFSFSRGALKYKMDQIDGTGYKDSWTKTSNPHNIHKNFDQKKAVFIGDTTQADPEVAADAVYNNPGWLRIIAIRLSKVECVPGASKVKAERVTAMEARNSQARFDKAYAKIKRQIDEKSVHVITFEDSAAGAENLQHQIEQILHDYYGIAYGTKWSHALHEHGHLVRDASKEPWWHRAPCGCAERFKKPVIPHGKISHAVHGEKMGGTGAAGETTAAAPVEAAA